MLDINCNNEVEAANRRIQYRKEVDQWREQSLLDQKMREEDIKVGDILCHSWGYDQTNIDFYEVVKATSKTAWVRRMKCEKTYTGSMVGTSVPAVGQYYDDKILNKRINSTREGTNCILFDRRRCDKWHGRPMQFTEYC